MSQTVKNVNQKLIFQPKYVVGIQKNRLKEKVLLSTQNMFKLMGKKLFTILGLKKLLIQIQCHAVSTCWLKK